MADTDTKVPETGADSKALENSNSVPQQNAEQIAAELEAARKEAEQAKMRANQLANEKAEAERKLAEAERAKLEEKEDYKTLWEQSQARYAEVVEREEKIQFQAQVSKKESEVTSEYSEEVLDIAKTAGVSLSGLEETDVAAYKQKLDVINEKVSKSAKNTPENHQNPSGENADKQAALERLRQGDRTAVTDAVGSLGFVKAYRKQLEQ